MVFVLVLVVGIGSKFFRIATTRTSITEWLVAGMVGSTLGISILGYLGMAVEGHLNGGGSWPPWWMPRVWERILGPFNSYALGTFLGWLFASVLISYRWNSKKNFTQ